MSDADYEALQAELSEMVLSASGWRKIFADKSDADYPAASNIKETDSILVCNAALAFLEFLKLKGNGINTIVIGRDSRPTGAAIEEAFLKTLLTSDFKINSIGIAAAPEIMAYSKLIGAAFIYISASHNPIEHNGFKFGLNSGGVIDAALSAGLISRFKELCLLKNSAENALQILEKADAEKIRQIKMNQAVLKKAALTSYYNFSKLVIANSSDQKIQNEFFDSCKKTALSNKQNGKPFCIVADFNGSARAASIDRAFFEAVGISLIAINEGVGEIRHGILPEGKNLEFCANKMQELHADKNSPLGQNAFLGYMPDCDGDRGNIIFWNEELLKPVILEAQEVFLLSVIAEISFLASKRDELSQTSSVENNADTENKSEEKIAVVVNSPTSLRVDEALSYFGVEVFRAEVGEANVVNLAKSLREKGYTVRILGEGSNGGNISHPASVRDPLNTIFAILKLLLIKTTAEKKGLFNLWCEKSNQIDLYKEDFSLADIIKTLPKYTTTPTGEPRAILKISTGNHGVLKQAYQKIFEQEWEAKKGELKKRLGIVKYRSFCNNGTEQTDDIKDFSLSGKGGLKIQFYNSSDEAVGFIWMRGSGTEPVFRIMADIKGGSVDAEKYLVGWQQDMVKKADAKVCE